MGGLTLLALIGAAITIILLPALGLLRLSLAMFLAATAVVPFAIVTWTSDTIHHTGIADTSPSVPTFALALCLLAMALIPAWRRNGWILAYVLCVTTYLALGLLTVWNGVETQWAGGLHLFVALVALVVGFQFGTQLTPDIYRYLVTLALVFFILNGALCLAQMSGLAISLFPDQLTEHISNNRPIGTFAHPSTVGKFALLLLVLTLPALGEADRRTRRMAWWCIALAIPVVALTYARANLAGVTVAIVLWLILDRRQRQANIKRLLLLVGVFALSAPVISATLNRFTTDPGGGDRALIYEAGLRQLQSNLWVGTGPNYYVEVVGRWDQMTAWGFPLHNSFLYPIAELGLIGGVLFLLPIFAVCAIAIVDWRSRGETSPWSLSYLVAMPGLFAIAMTGWGMLIGSTLTMWYFVIGLSAARILADRSGQAIENNDHDPSTDPSLISSRS